MADLYVCPLDGYRSRLLDDLVDHAVVLHGHDPDNRDCGCPSCKPEGEAR